MIFPPFTRSYGRNAEGTPSGLAVWYMQRRRACAWTFSAMTQRMSSRTPPLLFHFATSDHRIFYKQGVLSRIKICVPSLWPRVEQQWWRKGTYKAISTQPRAQHRCVVVMPRLRLRNKWSVRSGCGCLLRLLLPWRVCVHQNTYVLSADRIAYLARFANSSGSHCNDQPQQCR